MNHRRKHALAVVALTALFEPTRAQDFVAVDWDTSTIYAVDPANASLTLRCTADVVNIIELQYDHQGTLYAVTAGAPGGAGLYTIDLVTGHATQVALLNTSTYVFEGGLAFAPSGVLYLVNGDSAATDRLFAVDVSNGSTTMIGTIAVGSHDLNGLYWRSDGRLIGIDRSTNSALIIDPSNAQILGSFALTPTLGAVGGMTPRHGVVYYSTSGPVGGYPGSNSLYRFDPFTGVSVFVGSFAPTITGTGVSGLAGKYCGPPSVYCTGGTSTNGCTASISSSGTPSVSATSGFQVLVQSVEGLKQGVIFYGTSGAIAAPWSGTSSSVLCVRAPTQRTGTLNSGGTIFQCNGTLTFDWLAWLSSHPTALGAPFFAGESVWMQAWYRDPPAPKTTNLSNALRISMCP